MDGYKLKDYVPQANIPGSYPITGAHLSACMLVFAVRKPVHKLLGSRACCLHKQAHGQTPCS